MQRRTFNFNIGEELFRIDQFEGENKLIEGIQCLKAWHLYHPGDTDFYGALNHRILEIHSDYIDDVMTFKGHPTNDRHKGSVKKFIVIDDISGLSIVERAAVEIAVEILKQ